MIRPCKDCKFVRLTYDRKPCSECKPGGSKFKNMLIVQHPKMTQGERSKILRDSRRKKGLCPYCGIKLAKGERICQKHRDYMRQKSSEYYKNHRKSKHDQARNSQNPR